MTFSPMWWKPLALTALFTVATTVTLAGQQAIEEPQELLKQGNAAFVAKKYQEALKLFKESNKLQQNRCSPCYLGSAMVKARIGDVIAAEESVENALKVAVTSPQRASAHLFKGRLLMGSAAVEDPYSGRTSWNQKRLASAEQEFRQFQAGDPGDPDIHLDLAMVLLKQNRDEEGRKEAQTYLDASPAGKRAEDARKLIANPRLARELFAPDFHLITLDGEIVALKDLVGKIVVLDFWATWCPPCRASVGDLKDVVKKYPRETLVLISVSADNNASAWKDFIAKKQMEWPQYLDSDGHMRDTFAVNAFPTYLVINGEGIIQRRIVGTNPQESVVHILKETLKTMQHLN